MTAPHDAPVVQPPHAFGPRSLPDARPSRPASTLAAAAPALPPPRSAARVHTASALAAAMCACAVQLPAPKDPAVDTDPAPAVDTDPPVDSDQDSDPPAADTSASDPRPTGEVCYLGPDRAGDACVPVVDHDPRWGSDWIWPVSADPRYAAPVRLLDLDVIDPSTTLAPNFRLSEIAQAYKGRYGIVQPHLIEHLQAVRDAAGGALVVSSGFRNPAYNAGVGGVTFSRHQWGDAADLQPTTVDLAALGDLCVAQGAAFVDLYEAHVHCDWRDDALEPAFFALSPRRAGAAVPEPARRVSLVHGPPWTAPATGWDEGEPLREWTATDDRGTVIATGVGRSFAPPAEARRVSVRVGGRVTRSADLTP